MRPLVALSLLCGVLFADSVVKVSLQRLPVAAHSLSPMAAGRDHLPVAVCRVAADGTRILVLRLYGGAAYDKLLTAEPIGSGAAGSAVYIGSMRGRTASLLQLRVVGGRPMPVVYGQEQLNAVRNPRLLRIADRTGRPLMVFGHDGGALLSHPVRGRAGSSDLIARPGRRFIGATDLFDADGDKRADLFLLSADSRLVRLEADRPGGRLELVQDYPYRNESVVGKAIAGAPGEVWIGGTRTAGGMLLRFDPSADPSIHKFRDIFKDTTTGRRDSVEKISFGAGTTIDRIAIEGDLLVATGTRDGRAWAYAMLRSGRRRNVMPVSLTGRRVTALCINPSRVGWSFAVATDDKVVHMLRLSGDKAVPRGWDPLPTSTPRPRPTPTPTPTPQPQPGAAESIAYFPRVAADSRKGVDTVFFMLYVGSRARSLSVGLFDAGGKQLVRTTLKAKPGERLELSVAKTLRQWRFADMDGYAVITGCERRDLILGGVHHSGEPTYESEALRPFWR